MRRTAIPAIVTAALLVAGTACHPSSAEKAATGPTATVATEPAPTTTTDPYAIPSVIDAAYVNRVLAGLDQITGDVVRSIITTRNIPVEAYDRLKALYVNPDRLQSAVDGFQLDLRDNMAGYKAIPGNKTTTVTFLITGTPGCIFAQVRRNYDAVSSNPSPPVDPQWVGLRPTDKSRDPKNYNRTGWAYVYDGYPADRSRPADPCAS